MKLNVLAAVSLPFSVLFRAVTVIAVKESSIHLHGFGVPPLPSLLIPTMILSAIAVSVDGKLRSQGDYHTATAPLDKNEAGSSSVHQRQRRAKAMGKKSKGGKKKKSKGGKKTSGEDEKNLFQRSEKPKSSEEEVDEETNFFLGLETDNECSAKCQGELGGRGCCIDAGQGGRCWLNDPNRSTTCNNCPDEGPCYIDMGKELPECSNTCKNEDGGRACCRVADQKNLCKLNFGEPWTACNNCMNEGPCYINMACSKYCEFEDGGRKCCENAGQVGTCWLNDPDGNYGEPTTCNSNKCEGICHIDMTQPTQCVS